MIPYLHNAEAVCTNCTGHFHYDSSLSKRVPRVCPYCKTQRKQARSDRRKATAELTLPGKDLERLTVRTHAEVGNILGISAEGVRLAEQSALAKLRRAIDAANTRLNLPQ